MRPLLLIFYVLSIATLIYGLLLYLLETFATAESTSEQIIPDFLPLVFAGISLLLIIFLFQKMVPLIETKEKVSEVFPIMLMTSVIAETIGLFGLLLGLLNLFVNHTTVNWIVDGGFLAISFVLQFFLIQKKYTPKLTSLLGTHYSPSSSN